jgi:maleate isomerase
VTGVRIGVLLPGANPTVKPETAQLLPSHAALYTARMNAPPELDLRGRLGWYLDHSVESLQNLRNHDLAAVLVACAGASYPLGPDGDRAWSARLSGQFGAPVITAAGAVATALAALQVSRLSLVSPYPRWLTEQCAGFWRATGLHVDMYPVSGSDAIYRKTVESVRAAVRAALSDTSNQRRAVLVAGTGAPSLAVLEEAAGVGPVPVLSSNLAGVWALLGAAGAALSAASSPSGALRRLALDAGPASMGRLFEVQ